MSNGSERFSQKNWPVYAQGFLALAGLLAVISMPPSQGAMLILPLTSNSTVDTLNWASATGADLMALGPTPGSLVVYGQRARLSASAWQHFSILIAAPGRLCGATRRRKD